MYSLIRKNVGVLLDSIDPVTDVDAYCRLVDSLHNTNVGQDPQFQAAYRRYWQLNPARLSEPYLQAYFDLLERLKARPDTASVESVARELYVVPTHGNGRKSLQFSFSSKLVHMLKPDQPVYDSLIAAFYFLPTGGQGDGLELKLSRLLRSHAFLDREQARILDEGLLSDVVSQFRTRFAVSVAYTDRKVIDTLLWKFAGLLRQGALRDGIVVFE